MLAELRRRRRQASRNVRRMALLLPRPPPPQRTRTRRRRRRGRHRHEQVHLMCLVSTINAWQHMLVRLLLLLRLVVSWAPMVWIPDSCSRLLVQQQMRCICPDIQHPVVWLRRILHSIERP